MTEYQKIETLYEFDGKTHKYLDEFHSPIVKYLKDCPWIASEKIDGMNVRVHYDGHRVEWSGRTDKAQLPKEVEALLSERFGDSEVAFEQTFGEKDAILFMECYGGKIQGGLYGGEERLIGLDVMVNGSYLDRFAAADVFAGFGVEPIGLFLIPNIKFAVAYVSSRKEPSEHCLKGTTPIEGLVCVPAVRLYDNKGNRVIVKIKKRDLAKMGGPAE